MKCLVVTLLAVLSMCWEGEAYIRDPCAGFDCGVGTCTAPADAPFCICPSGYTYDSSSRTCVRIIRDPCAGFDCGVGTCTAPADAPFCICPSGYRYDSSKRTCVKDKCPPCGIDECGLFPPDQTPYTCPFGFARDECGCVDPSDCSCENCPQFDRTLNCPLGFKVDARGCPKSECVEPTPTCHPCGIHECGLFPPDATPYTCPNGYAKDDCGCVTSCQCAGCPRFDSNVFCPYGYRTRRGCPTSTCNPRPPGAPAARRRCPIGGEPLGPIGRPCSQNSHCKATDQICCTSINTSKSCLNGIPTGVPSPPGYGK